MRINTYTSFACMLILFISLPSTVFSQESIITFHNKEEKLINKKIQILTDKKGTLNIYDILHDSSFEVNNSTIINKYFHSRYTYWLKFKLTNASAEENLYLSVDAPILNKLTFFKIKGNKILFSKKTGIDYPFKKRETTQTRFIFDLLIPPGDTALYYLKIKNISPLNLTLSISNKSTIIHNYFKRNIIASLYLGIMLSLFLYNLFLYFSLKERSYLYYIIYTLFIFLTQISLFGYTYKILWPNSPSFNNLTIVLFPAISGIFAILFSKKFLETKKNNPTLDKGFNIFIVLYGTIFILSLIGFSYISYRLIDIVAMVVSLYALATAIYMISRGYKSAILYLASFLMFILAICIFVLKNAGVFPKNLFTDYSLFFGTSLQAILLSFALADKINEYRREKDRAHLAVLRAVQEKEEYVRQENVVLEAKVKQRTADLVRSNDNLQKSNTDLNIALENLKKAETQLVHAEKMASLGQLTAGIAHEINNPINFVKSNVQPLKRDLNDLSQLIIKYKQINKNNIDEKLKEISAFVREIDLDILEEEIPILISGIEEGADRTIEIVKGLREFSRSNENVVKKIDIHAGIESTLGLLKKIIPNNITVKKEYGPLPLIEGYPGQLNQVFVNLLTNAAQAIEEIPDRENQYIAIKTKSKDAYVAIHISDTGPGIPEEAKNKIFDPFFTTKDVGKGTGLGLSIVYSIIERHGGDIKVISEKEKGTEFIITLPVTQPFSEEPDLNKNYS